MSSLRVMFVTTGLATGGAETALLRLLRHLPSGIELAVVSLTDEGTMGARMRDIGVPVTCVGMRPTRVSPMAIARLIRLIRDYRPDVVQTWMYHADLLGGLAARMAGVQRVVWGIRNSNLNADKSRLVTRAVVKTCAMISSFIPTAIISCSRRAAQIHAAIGYRADKFTVLPNGIELDCFQPDPLARHEVRQELGISADVPLIGMIGRFDPQKNHQGFFEAAALVGMQRPDAHFLLAGRGIHGSNVTLCTWRDVAGLTDRTYLLGERNDVPRLMAALDVLVSSSSWGEGFPNVLAEAMACGVPVVATDVGDSSDIVGDSGRIVPPEDMQGLAAAVIEILLRSPEDRLAASRRARSRIAADFEIVAIARRYADFYLGLVQACAA